MNFNIQKAVEYYYRQLEIGTSDIQEIYGCSKAKAVELKKQVRKYQVESEIMFMDSRKVSTKLAFQCWKLDIKELESNYRKLLSLELLSNNK